MPSDYIQIAKIIRPHGIAGAVKIRSYTENPASVKQYKQFYLEAGTPFAKVTFVGGSEEAWIAKIKDVTSKEEADRLKGTLLYIKKQDLPALESDNEFYPDDLVGLEARDAESGRVLGDVTGFYNFGASDIIEITFKDTKKERMFTFTDQVVPMVDIEQGYLTIQMPEILEAKPTEE